MEARPTASIIIIGDEILKGHIKETNSYFLCHELYKCGVKVPRVSVIPDDVDAIAAEVLEHSKNYTFVLTTGGIGPTHDDVTYEGVAKAFDEKLVLNKDVQRLFSHLFPTPFDEIANCKMASIPQSAEIHYSANSRKQTMVPIVSINNVFIFPGIPRYLKMAFEELKSLFCSNASPYFNQNLYVDASEYDLTKILNCAVKEYHPRVKLGSYPDTENNYYAVKLTLEANCEKDLIEAEAYLRSHLPKNRVVGQFPPTSYEALTLLLNICNEKPNDDDFVKSLNESMKILRECFNKYSPSEVCLSFNGGKDCTALLHLTYLFLSKIFHKTVPKPNVLYVRSKQPFPEISEFIKLSVERYNLKLLSYEQPIKEALYKMQAEQPSIKAVLMGCRQTDPRCSSLQPFQMTDSDWPQFMRINPLSNWSYPQVWQFLRRLEVPYCGLYDRGYTSLGCQHNTLPNEKLLATTKCGETYYLPAYLLKEAEQERQGRAAKH